MVKETSDADAHPTVFESSVTQREGTLPVVVPSVASVASVIKRNDVDFETINAPLNRANDRMNEKGENDSSSHQQQQQPAKDRAYYKVPSVKDSRLHHGKSVPVRTSSLMTSNNESDNCKPPQAQARRQQMKLLSTSSKMSNTVQAQSARKSNPARALATNVGVSTITGPPVPDTTPELYNNAAMKQVVEQYQSLMMQQMSMWPSMLQLQQQYANSGLGPMVITPTSGSNFGLSNRFTRGRGRSLGRGRGRGKGRSSIRGKQERLSHSLNRNSTRGSVTRTTMGRGSAQKKASKSVGGRTQHLKWTRPPSLENELFSKR
eukprot:151877_1